MPAPFVAGAPTTGLAGSGTSITVAKPAGLADGDVLLFSVRGQTAGATADIANATHPFERVGPAFVASSTDGRLIGAYIRPVASAGSEPASYTFTHAGSGGRLTGSLTILRGVNLAGPVVAAAAGYAGAVLAGGRRASSYALSETPALVVFLSGNEFTSGNASAPTATPSGYTQVVATDSGGGTGVSRTGLWVGVREQTSSPVADADIIYSATAAPAAQSIAFRGLPDNEGLPAYDGNGDVVHVYVTTPTGPVTPSSIEPVRPGFTDVNHMLATPGFTMAHRGSSSRYAEMSLHAYTQAVARNYGVLEVSLARTSDGVWFGLHDDTINRTSGLAAGTLPLASEMTWAQIQGYLNTRGSDGRAQPYMRWDDYVAAYGGTHVTFVDPKFAHSFTNEFISMVLNDLGDRAVVKYYYTNTILAGLAATAGMPTWGFAYETDIPDPSFAARCAAWDILGMEYSAPQTAWDAVLAFGKPVIGHIAGSQDAYDTAITRGAVGVQCAASHLITAVGPYTA